MNVNNSSNSYPVAGTPPSASSGSQETAGTVTTEAGALGDTDVDGAVPLASSSSSSAQTSTSTRPPELDAPKGTYTSTEISLLVNAWMQKLNGLSMDNAMTNIDTKKELLKVLNEEAVKKIEEICKKAQEEEDARNSASAWAWTQAIGGAVLGGAALAGAIAATVMTGGAAAPLLVAASLSFYAGVASCVALDNPDMKIDLGTAFFLAAKEIGDCSDEEAQKWSIGLNVAMTVVLLASAIAMGRSDTLKELPSMVKTFSTVVGCTAAVFEGTTAIGKGSVALQIADIELAMANIAAEDKKLSASLARVQFQIEMLLDMLGDLADADAKRTELLSGTLEAAHTSSQGAVHAIA
jgi:hypothetical protein